MILCLELGTITINAKLAKSRTVAFNDWAISNLTFMMAHAFPPAMCWYYALTTMIINNADVVQIQLVNSPKFKNQLTITRKFVCRRQMVVYFKILKSLIFCFRIWICVGFSVDQTWAVRATRLVIMDMGNKAIVLYRRFKICDIVLWWKYVCHWRLLTQTIKGPGHDSIV